MILHNFSTLKMKIKDFHETSVRLSTVCMSLKILKCSKTFVTLWLNYIFIAEFRFLTE